MIQSYSCIAHVSRESKSESGKKRERESKRKQTTATILNIECSMYKN